ncbi:tetratricopeptide repeat protein [Acidovorax sp. SDU_ACID1]|uniref:O-linked N-acetylglucosamine transferase family protein n=1 Tax=Acidovorax sp. SDU_ACID1 TaxID=3136632 RepID=UPI003873C4D7
MASSKKTQASQLFTQSARPADLAAELQRAVALHRAGQWAQAGAAYERILALQPGNFSCLHLLGVLMLQGGRHGDAERLISRAIGAQPNTATPYINLALAQSGQHKYDNALDSIAKALALQPDLVEAQVNRGAILVQAKRSQEAVDQLDRLISTGHGTAEVWTNRGIALAQLRHYPDALESYRKALSIAPAFPKAHYNMGTALIETRNYGDALQALDRAISSHPNYAEAFSAKGQALHGLGNPGEAKPWHERAAALKPHAAQILLSYANCLVDLREYEAAHRTIEAALSADPQLADAYVAGGHLLACQWRHEDALANYDHALQINPLLESAYFFKATSEMALKRYADALQSMQRCTESGRFDTMLARQYCRMMVCDWTDFDGSVQRICEEIQPGKPAELAFALLSLIDDPALHLIAASNFASKWKPAATLSPKPHGTGKIKIGYYSADFHDHATTFLMAELFESHDTERFEIYAFSFGPAQAASRMLERITRKLDHFIEVHGKSDEEIAALSQSLGIDVAVDLKGFTTDARFGIFAARCAPLQVSYLGYPGTTGADFIDYVIADKTVIPESQQAHYTEKVIYLPHSYQVNDSQRAISSRVFERQELGLPQQAFVFCCFNSSNKILPATFDAWMRLLRNVDGSVLWLLQSNTPAMQNLRKEAEARGVDGMRLVFAEYMPLEEHLARYRLADLFIDTFPYNAHTTASDALWAGLPVLTRTGQSFASRVAASLLTAIGLPELITHTPADFEAKAIALAHDPGALRAIRDKLDHQRLRSPLFDGVQFTRHMESAYIAMHERYCQGLAPAAMEIKA